MTKFIAISECIKITPSKKVHIFNIYLFHFRGFFKGKKIYGIKIISNNKFIFKINNRYILYLKLIKISDQYIIAQTIKYKKINNLL